MLACISAGITTPLRAQEYSPVVNDRVDSGVAGMSEVAVEDRSERKRALDLGAVISAAYDSNVFLSKDKPEKDTVYRVAPAIAYTQGDEKEGEGGFIRFAWRPTAVAYAKTKSANRIDHEAAITAGWRGKVTKLTYTGAVQKLGDATADTGRPTDRVVFENELRAAWMPREKVTLELAAGNRQSDYKDPAFFDSRKTYGEVAARFAYSPKTELSIAYQAGTFEVDSAGRQRTQQLTAGIDWQPREKIRVKLDAGAEHRKTDNGSSVNPVVEGRVDWKPRKGTELYVSAYQREEASAFFAGQNYNVKGGTVGISQRLGDKWTGRLEGGRESSTYNRVAGSGFDGRKDKMWFIRPSLEYRLNDQFDVSLFYRVSDNSSTSSDFGYDQKMAGIELNCEF